MNFISKSCKHRLWYSGSFPTFCSPLHLSSLIQILFLSTFPSKWFSRISRIFQNQQVKANLLLHERWMMTKMTLSCTLSKTNYSGTHILISCSDAGSQLMIDNPGASEGLFQRLLTILTSGNFNCNNLTNS